MGFNRYTDTDPAFFKPCILKNGSYRYRLSISIQIQILTFACIQLIQIQQIQIQQTQTKKWPFGGSRWCPGVPKWLFCCPQGPTMTHMALWVLFCVVFGKGVQQTPAGWNRYRSKQIQIHLKIPGFEYRYFENTGIRIQIPATGLYPYPYP